jgi:hypothetical protein
MPRCCARDADCSDAYSCTNDRCVNRTCVITPVVCTTSDRCQATFCDPSSGACSSIPVTCDDNDPCTDDACAPDVGCIHEPTANPPSPSEASCSDGVDDDCDGVFDSGDTDCLTAEPSCGGRALEEMVKSGTGQGYVTPQCDSDVKVCCAAGTPDLSCGPLVLDLLPKPGDQPRLEIVEVPDTDRLDVVLRARVRSQNGLPVSLPLLGECNLQIDSQPGTDQDLQFAFSVTDDGSPAGILENWSTTKLEAADSSFLGPVCSLAPSTPATSIVQDTVASIVHDAICACACDDENPCTRDTCRPDGSCGHDVASCDDGDACTVDSCSSVSGCAHAPAAAGTACNDGNPCTQADRCEQGACVGGSPVVCAAMDQCHGAGTCDPVTGACSNPTLPDMTECSTDHSCNGQGMCLHGICAGLPCGPCTPTCDGCGPDEFCAQADCFGGICLSQ